MLFAAEADGANIPIEVFDCFPVTKKFDFDA